MNENTVKTRLYRSLKKLRLEVEDKGYRVNTKKDKTPAKTFGIVVVAALLTATLVFNLSPSLAAAAYDIPIIGDIVRVITFNRFEYHDKGYNADINVPEIQGLLDPELQDRLNTEFREYADEYVRAFEAGILELEELGDDTAQMIFKADYIVKTDNDSVLAIDAYIYSEVSGLALHKFCTIDKRTGTLVTLPSLFKPEADYITPVSAYLTAEMERINSEEEGEFLFSDVPDEYGYFCKIRLDHSFYINDTGELVICFEKYEIAPGYIGSPEFVIPIEVIADIVSSDLIN